jgi:hypothetical protein
MNDQTNDSEIELNKYFAIIEKDLDLLKKDKNNASLRKKISSNIDLVPYELDYYAMWIDNADSATKKTLEISLADYQAKFKKLQDRFIQMTNAGLPKVSATEMAMHPDKIAEVAQKINLCDMKGDLKRAAGV